MSSPSMPADCNASMAARASAGAREPSLTSRGDATTGPQFPTTS